MANTMRQPQTLTQLDSIRATQGGPLIDVDRGAEILAILRRTHGELGYKQEVAASRSHLKPQQYSAAINGNGHYSIVWLFQQELPFILRVLELAMEHFGLDATNRKAVRALRILELTRLLTDD